MRGMGPGSRGAALFRGIGGRGWSDGRDVVKCWPEQAQSASGKKGKRGESGEKQREGGRKEERKEKKKEREKNISGCSGFSVLDFSSSLSLN